MKPLSIDNECYTPKSFIQPIVETFGQFTLDPFSCAEANKTINAVNYFDKDNTCDVWNLVDPVIYKNHLVWCNPCYQRGYISTQVDRFLYFATAWHFESFLLVNSETSSKWYQKSLSECNGLLFPSPRVQFFNPYKDFKSTNTKPQTLFYFGNRSEYLNKLNTLGAVIIR